VRIGFLPIAAVVMVFAAACTSGGTPAPGPTSPPPSSAVVTTPSATGPSPTPSRTGPLTTGAGVLPGEKPPVLYDYAKAHTPSGALAFATYYMKAYDWGVATTDPTLVAQISATSCQTCRNYIAELTSLRDKGGHVEGGRTTLLSSKLVTGSFKTKSDFVADFALSEDAIVLVAPGEARSTSAPKSTYESLVFVSWDGKGWRIVEEGSPT
jgi:hypothetical protein